MTVNYDRVCRLCMSFRGELLPIFPTISSDELEPPILATKIKDCVSVQINENDELPTNICRKCMDNVNNWHLFKTVCAKTQNKLLSLSRKDGSLLEEVQVKNEPSDEAYDDGVVIDGIYPENEQAVASKLQPEGPPILASLGLTPRSDKGMESDKDEEEDYEDEVKIPQPVKVPHMPEVSITVMRPTGETLQSRQGIQQIASKDCLICGRSYRYSHNARRHELNTHKFDRYTNRINKPKSHTRMQPKLRPNPFNPKARLMPNPISHKMQLLPKMSPKFMPQHQNPQFHRKIITPPKPIPIKFIKTPQNNLPYPLRIKALKDLQIKKKEPQILKTLLTAKPEVLVSEPEIMNSGPESPETLISEPEIASFQVETILSEPNDYDENEDEEGDSEMHNHQSHNYDTVDMDSENEIEIARQQGSLEDNEENPNEDENQQDDDNNFDEADKEDENDSEKASPQDVTQAATEDDSENMVIDENEETKEDEPNNEEEEDEEDNDETNNDELDASQVEQNEDDEEILGLTPQIELNEELRNNSTMNEMNDEEEMDETAEGNDTVDGEAEEPDAPQGFVTSTQRDFIKRYRDIILQINTQRCLCCDKEYPRRKSVIQHLQKNGYKVPKHTCYNCVVTFTHIGALLSHMRHNNCTDLWKIIYEDNGITSDMVIEEPKSKIQTKDIFNAKSYACRLCTAKFQLKQSIMKHVSEFHEDGQSSVPMGCVHCGASFKDKTLLKKHIRNGECTVYIHCDLCSEQFTNMQEFNDHALSAHAEHFVKSENQSVDGRLTDCYLCGTKTSSYSNLLKHFKAEHDQILHPCQFCGVKFEQPVDLNKHMYLEHPGQTPDLNATRPDMSLVKEEAEEYHYSCTECNAIFETVDEWTDHQVAEHNQVAHHCDQCEKKFLRPSELAEHKNTHLRVKFYPCSVCSNSYSTPQKLADHVQNSHPGAGTNVSPDHEFFCEMCIRPFKSRQAYSNHMRIHAKVPTTNRKPQTPQALKEFDPRIIGKPIKQFNMSNLVQSPNVYNFKPNANVPNAPYSCDICGKGFMHKKNIWKHKKVLHADIINDRNDSEENTMHASTEEDDYNVDENGSVLSTPQFNSFAFPVEPSPSVHECELCGKQFPLKSSLIKHKRAKHGIVNTNHAIKTESQASPSEGGGRSSCTICKITFADKKSYYRHRKNVHKSATQMCKICGKPLNSTQELYEHLKAAHASLLLGYDANQSTSKNQDDMDPEYDEPEIANPNIEYQARYPCDTCGKQFLGLLSLQNHQCVSQPPSQPQTFDCEICHKSYTSIAALKSHRGWHLRSPDGKAAANNSGLWMPQHKVTSKVSKHEVLEAAQSTGGRSQSTPSVAKRRLPPEVEVTVVNPNKKMRSDDSVEMEQHGDAVEGKYCTICDKEFTKRAAYQRHMDEVHQPNSVFCPVCDKSFTRKSTLLVHMKKHYEGGGEGSSTAQVDEDDGFPCEVCGAQYDTENALRAHKIRHHGDEESGDSEDDGEVPMPAQPGEFTCGQCGDGVATARDLITHRAIHSTHTKFFCNICKVYFARALDLSSHTRARHADNEKVFFPCAMCDRFYMNKKSLQRHIDMVH